MELTVAAAADMDARAGFVDVRSGEGEGAETFSSVRAAEKKLFLTGTPLSSSAHGEGGLAGRRLVSRPPPGVTGLAPTKAGGPSSQWQSPLVKRPKTVRGYARAQGQHCL
jgi:hypothetical protein